MTLIMYIVTIYRTLYRAIRKTQDKTTATSLEIFEPEWTLVIAQIEPIVISFDSSMEIEELFTGTIYWILQEKNGWINRLLLIEMIRTALKYIKWDAFKIFRSQTNAYMNCFLFASITFITEILRSNLIITIQTKFYRQAFCLWVLDYSKASESKCAFSHTFFNCITSTLHHTITSFFQNRRRSANINHWLFTDYYFVSYRQLSTTV